MADWRERLENPYKNLRAYSKDGTKQWNLEEVFQEGARELVSVLIKESAYMTPEQMKLLAPDRKYPYGWLVFIPAQPERDEPAEKVTMKDWNPIKAMGIGEG